MVITSQFAVPSFLACIGVLVLLVPISAYAPLSDESLRGMPEVDVVDFDIHAGPLLSPILVPRVPGTPGSTAVLNHFVEYFHTYLPLWTITFQNSTWKTPLSGNDELPFVNLIATRDPPGASVGDVGRLNLVAHYDSKLTPDGFIGAIDSAAPCAMILHAVRAIDAALSRKWSPIQAEGVDSFDGIQEHKGIQVLLLDGEEAFVSWSETDSLYGARAMAEEWDGDVHPALSTYRNKLESIELFLLLDLLGAQDPRIPSYFKTTHWVYANMAKLEQRLRQSDHWRSSKQGTWLPDAAKDPHTSPQFPSYALQDDHLPFMARGVQVLHLIPLSFPPVWHKIEDDGEHLHLPTVLDWATLIAAFSAEWLELDGFFPAPQAKRTGASRPWTESVISKTEL